MRVKKEISKRTRSPNQRRPLTRRRQKNNSYVSKNLTGLEH